LGADTCMIDKTKLAAAVDSLYCAAPGDLVE